MKRRTRKSVRKGAKNYESEETFPKNFDFSKIHEKFILPHTEENTFQYDISTSPQSDLLLQLKKDRTRFFKTIIFAVILHLSAVTLFKIVVYIPRTDLQYLDIRVVQAEVDSSDNIPSASRLRLSKNLESTDMRDDVDIKVLRGTNTFELPKVEFEELEKLKLRRTLVEEDTIPKPLSEEYKDSWAQFGEGINRIRKSISSLSPFSQSTDIAEKEGEESSSAPLMKQQIGNGIEILFRWINPPYNRTILFFPGLLEISKNESLNEDKDYDFLLTVSPDGSVIKVVDLNIVEDEISKYINEEVKKIRFEPIIDPNTPEQQLTIRYRISRNLL